MLAYFRLLDAGLADGASTSSKLLLCALLEVRIIFHSTRPELLAPVAEALRSLLFPFRLNEGYTHFWPVLNEGAQSAEDTYTVCVDSPFRTCSAEH